jgi:hypothetical protein
MLRSESTGYVLAGDDPTVREAVQRLDREFHHSINPKIIVSVVRHSWCELDSPSPGALPELLERLARQRLLQHAAEN